MQKVLIKGAGDLASGIAWRLRRAGFNVLMTEIAQPLTVRLTVAYSNAVYEGQTEIEGIKGILVHDYSEAQEVMKKGDIAVIVDEDANIKDEFKPNVIIDAIMAKKNINTDIDDAPIVIAVGPGFCAGTSNPGIPEPRPGSDTLPRTPGWRPRA